LPSATSKHPATVGDLVFPGLSPDTVFVDAPETRYARSGDLNIAYQVLGEGPFDVVFVPGSVSHVELAWQVGAQSYFYRQLASFCRLIRFDKRGTGMSDRVAGVADLETRMDDVRAVMDAAGSRQAALLGASEGGPMSVLFAATYPERVWALVLYGTFARIRWAPDYPSGDTDEALDRELQEDLDFFLHPERATDWVERYAPSLDAEEARAWATMTRQSASPGDVEALHHMVCRIDVRNVLPAITAPTLVLNRSGDRSSIVGGSRYLAQKIGGARHVELEGSDHSMSAGDPEPVLEAIESFVTDAWAAAQSQGSEPDRVLATVLFTDIVGSTQKAVELGDARWRELLEAHHTLIRRELLRFRGRELDTAGDGFFASFDGPARAITNAVRDLGLEVRAGLHTGECELVDGKIGGIAVHIGARVAKEAMPGEVLVSSTVKDLVAGSGLRFRERGAAELKGAPGQWQLFAAEQGPIAAS
jgi:pimeloyl-ACP methyl ester carboxylesterase